MQHLTCVPFLAPAVCRGSPLWLCCRIPTSEACPGRLSIANASPGGFRDTLRRGSISGTATTDTMTHCLSWQAWNADRQGSLHHHLHTSPCHTHPYTSPTHHLHTSPCHTHPYTSPTHHLHIPMSHTPLHPYLNFCHCHPHYRALWACGIVPYGRGAATGDLAGPTRTITRDRSTATSAPD